MQDSPRVTFSAPTVQIMELTAEESNEETLEKPHEEPLERPLEQTLESVEQKSESLPYKNMREGKNVT